jgi:hypothetical protein
MTAQEQPPEEEEYPHGRGYGQDYMRGGEVGDGYGYATRDEYERPRGERNKKHAPKKPKQA